MNIKICDACGKTALFYEKEHWFERE